MYTKFILKAIKAITSSSIQVLDETSKFPRFALSCGNEDLLLNTTRRRIKKEEDQWCILVVRAVFGEHINRIVWTMDGKRNGTVDITRYTKCYWYPPIFDHQKYCVVTATIYDLSVELYQSCMLKQLSITKQEIFINRMSSAFEIMRFAKALSIFFIMTVFVCFYQILNCLFQKMKVLRFKQLDIWNAHFSVT